MGYGTKKSSSKGKGKKDNKVCKTDTGHRPVTPVESAAFRSDAIAPGHIVTQERDLYRVDGYLVDPGTIPARNACAVRAGDAVLQAAILALPEEGSTLPGLRGLPKRWLGLRTRDW